MELSKSVRLAGENVGRAINNLAAAVRQHTSALREGAKLPAFLKATFPEYSAGYLHPQFKGLGIADVQAPDPIPAVVIKEDGPIAKYFKLAIQCPEEGGMRGAFEKHPSSSEIWKLYDRLPPRVTERLIDLDGLLGTEARGE